MSINHTTQDTIEPWFSMKQSLFIYTIFCYAKAIANKRNSQKRLKQAACLAPRYGYEPAGRCTVRDAISTPLPALAAFIVIIKQPLVCIEAARQKVSTMSYNMPLRDRGKSHSDMHCNESIFKGHHSVRDRLYDRIFLPYCQIPKISMTNSYQYKTLNSPINSILFFSISKKYQLVFK